jgi:hypothetical protein
MKLTDNHLEQIFDIESGTTIAKAQGQVAAPNNVAQANEIVQTNDMDTAGLINEEDREVSQQLATVYGYAIEAFEQQTQMVTEVDPRFAARNAEVAAQYLNIALNSVNSRATIRNNKLKLKADGTNPNTVNNNLIVADRNELLKLLGEQK